MDAAAEDQVMELLLVFQFVKKRRKLHLINYYPSPHLAYIPKDVKLRHSLRPLNEPPGASQHHVGEFASG